MSKIYYTHCEDPEHGTTFYIIMDMAKPFDQLGRAEKEPLGDEKMQAPSYLDPTAFWEKLNERYIASL